MAPTFIGNGVAVAVRLGHPTGGGEEDVPLGLPLGYQDAVQANVVHDNTVGKVIHSERDSLVMPVPPHLQVRGDNLARSDDDLGRSGFRGLEVYVKRGGVS